jgi:hypothetical protein
VPEDFITVRWKKPYRVALRMGVVAGRLECIEVRVGTGDDSRPVTWELMRQLPLGKLTTQAAQTFARVDPAPGPGLPLNWAEMSPGSRRAWENAPHVVAAREEQAHIRTAARIRAATSTGEKLQIVADIYTEAHRDRRQPTQAVAEAFGVSSQAAAQLVRRARTAKPPFLPPTTPGKANAGSRRRSKP